MPSVRKLECVSPLVDSLSELIQLQVTIQHNDWSRDGVLAMHQPVLVLGVQVGQEGYGEIFLFLYLDTLQTNQKLNSISYLASSCNDPFHEDFRVTPDVDNQVHPHAGHGGAGQGLEPAIKKGKLTRSYNPRLKEHLKI